MRKLVALYGFGLYKTLMRRENTLKHIGFSVLALSLFGTNSAFAQTQVSASVNMSGSCASCDLSNRVMPRLSLQGSNFSGSNFSRSNLSGGKFHKSNLAGASFHKAYLMRVEGGYTNLRGANLRDATLIEAKLTNSDISHSDLRRADLTNGIFIDSSFILSDLTSVDAVNANFRGANFSNARLEHGDFENANFTKSVLREVKFGNAHVQNAIFTDADFSGADLLNVAGLSQAQLNLACGDSATKLPSGLVLSTCDFKAPETVTSMADLNIAPPLSSYQNQNRLSIANFAKPSPARVQTAQASAIDLALIEINATLRDLPLNSPLHKRLSKSRELLHQAKTSNPNK